MRKLSAFATFFFAVFSLVMASSAMAADGVKAVDWNAFSKNIQKALSSENEGLKESALRHIAHYGENVKLGKGIIEIMSIVRNHENQNMRQLALTALSKTGSKMAIAYIGRAVRFEKSPVVKRQMMNILKEAAKK